MRIEALTFFRFIAALIVVIFHFGKHTDFGKMFQPFLLSGPQMVTFFFVLSGFVLMVSHYHKKSETLHQFYWSRVARIVPLYMLALFIMLYFEYGDGYNNPVGFTLSLTFLQSWFPPYAMSFNIPGWSLSVEAFFYLTFPFIIVIVKYSQIKWWKLSLFAILFYIFTQAILSNYMSHDLYPTWPSEFHDTLHYSPLFHYCSFILGVTGGYLYVNNKTLLIKNNIFSFFIMIFMIYIMYYFLQNPDYLTTLFGVPLAYKSSFYALLFIILILSIAYSNNMITRFLSLPLFVILGEASYAIYIFQQPVHVVYNKYIEPYLDFSHNNHFYTYLFLLIIFSILIFLFIEKPMNHLIKVKFVHNYHKNKSILN